MIIQGVLGWFYLMKHKSETFTLLIQFFNHINRQFNTHISRLNSGSGDVFLPQLQTIRSDNGSEFLSKQIQQWFHDNGIIHQLVVSQPHNKMVL